MHIEIINVIHNKSPRISGGSSNIYLENGKRLQMYKTIHRLDKRNSFKLNTRTISDFLFIYSSKHSGAQ